MKSVFLSILSLVMVCMIQLSCSSKKDPVTGVDKDKVTDTNDIYVVGYEKNASNVSVAKLWKNGEATDLSDGQKEGVAKSVYVAGSDVYVAGFVTNAAGRKVATLWKNGVATSLSDGTGNADATSVIVVGNDVYVAGADMVGVKLNPVFWKNGSRIVLPMEAGGLGGGADGIYVQGSNIFVAGHELPQKAKYWRNAVSTVMPAEGANTFLVRGIAVSGNDIYVVGTANVNAVFRARLWKNGVLEDLNLGSYLSTAAGVFVAGSDVYVAGSEAEANNLVYGKIWKNGVATKLISESNSVTGKGVFVVGSDVYAVGDKIVAPGNTAVTVWKNTKELKQYSNSKNVAEAYGLFVVKK